MAGLGKGPAQAHLGSWQPRLTMSKSSKSFACSQQVGWVLENAAGEQDPAELDKVPDFVLPRREDGRALDKIVHA